jgi:hypothetical protein
MRRTLTLAILTFVTFVVAACSSPTAPSNSDGECRGGWGGANGRTCT